MSTRIVGGSAGGRRIKAPTGPHTRPTTDRVREALFSAIDSSVGSLSGLRFLDLYAGSGAVGLEARSRGAGVVTLVEQDRRAAALIRVNAQSLGFDGTEVLALPVSRALEQPPRAPYDVAFADPPYSLDAGSLSHVLELADRNGWLSRRALVVVERSDRDGTWTWPAGFERDRSRSYGDTRLWYGRAATGR